MDQKTIDFIAERAKVLASDPSAKQETQAAAQACLDAIAAGASGEAAEAATKQLVDFLEGRPNNIDGVIGFAQGPAVQIMGEEVAAQFLAKQLARKEQGEKWCDCPACTAAVAILTECGRL